MQSVKERKRNVSLLIERNATAIKCLSEFMISITDEVNSLLEKRRISIDYLSRMRVDLQYPLPLIQYYYIKHYLAGRLDYKAALFLVKILEDKKC